VEPPRQDNYVKLGESIILSCVAEGTPTPAIEWFKEAQHLDPARLAMSPKGKRVKIANQGMELRVTDIRQEDLGDYTCMAKNGVPPHASSIARIMLAGKERRLCVCTCVRFLCTYSCLRKDVTSVNTFDFIFLSSFYFNKDLETNFFF
jgi:hypothetical protein